MRVLLLTVFSSLALASIPPLLRTPVVKRQSSGDCGSLSPCGTIDCYDPSTEVCCFSYSAHCPNSEYCAVGDDGQPGCCPKGEICSGGGGIVTTGTVTGTAIETSTPTLTRTPSAGTFTRTTPTLTTTSDAFSSIQASLSSELASISRSAASVASSLSSRASSLSASTSAATATAAAGGNGAASGATLVTAPQYAAVGLLAALVLA